MKQKLGNLFGELFYKHTTDHGWLIPTYLIILLALLDDIKSTFLGCIVILNFFSVLHVKDIHTYSLFDLRHAWSYYILPVTSKSLSLTSRSEYLLHLFWNYVLIFIFFHWYLQCLWWWNFSTINLEKRRDCLEHL